MKLRKVILKTFMDTSVAREQPSNFLKLNNCIRGEFTARIVYI